VHFVETGRGMQCLRTPLSRNFKAESPDFYKDPRFRPECWVRPQDNEGRV
jgi:hypothetical protein